MIENQPPESAAQDHEVKAILERARTIAVVGISHKEERDSNRVARYLKNNGYAMIPVNPKYKEVMGEKCYPDLKSVPTHIDIVDIFRNIEAIPPIVDEAITAGANCVWMQLGLAHKEAADKALKAGLSVVMNKCIMVEHARLLPKHGAR